MQTVDFFSSEKISEEVNGEQSYSRYIKIEFDLVRGKKLSGFEEQLVSLIHNYSKRPEGCTAGNFHFSQVFKKSPKAISDSISRLVKKGVISRQVFKTKNGSRRIMRSLLSPLEVRSGLDFKSIRVTESTPQNTKATPQFEDATPQITEPTPHVEECMHSVKCGPDIKKEIKEHIKEREKEKKLSLSKNAEWEELKSKTKTLVEFQFGSYNPIEQKEERAIKNWITHEGKLYTESILILLSQLIAIKESDQFGQKTFWDSIPVTIASSFSYREQIRNTYPLLSKSEEKKEKGGNPTWKRDSENMDELARKRNEKKEQNPKRPLEDNMEYQGETEREVFMDWWRKKKYPIESLVFFEINADASKYEGTKKLLFEKFQNDVLPGLRCPGLVKVKMNAVNNVVEIKQKGIA
ncbi:hypothetical protein EHQ76_07215 [Leptospira barantonii]|uniref:Helix-turn-helix domain-containing protein n=1 Tax=Leptospira barantonii TaxID=2023184 RepID=A0A5F2BGY2_9LEPT|nr:hypothetical protein [Leptospira barantonii]TGM04828.1 hypothetical protein EHQ76_07215 [Leptospira barantonii]